MRVLAATAVLGLALTGCHGGSTHGQSPVTSSASPVPTASGIALGNGPVRVFVNNAGDLRRGQADLASTSSPAWLALKTHFFTPPSYRGPFLVRAARLDRAGPIVLGQSPAKDGPLFAPAGAAANGANGWREFPYSTFVKAP